MKESCFKDCLVSPPPTHPPTLVTRTKSPEQDSPSGTVPPKGATPAINKSATRSVFCSSVLTYVDFVLFSGFSFLLEITIVNENSIVIIFVLFYPITYNVTILLSFKISFLYKIRNGQIAFLFFLQKTQQHL